MKVYLSYSLVSFYTFPSPSPFLLLLLSPSYGNQGKEGKEVLCRDGSVQCPRTADKGSAVAACCASKRTWGWWRGGCHVGQGSGAVRGSDVVGRRTRWLELGNGWHWTSKSVSKTINKYMEDDQSLISPLSQKGFTNTERGKARMNLERGLDWN